MRMEHQPNIFIYLVLFQRENVDDQGGFNTKQHSGDVNTYFWQE